MAITYDVYFGTDSTPDAGEFQVNQTGLSYNPGTLNYSSTYYWRVDSVNEAGTTEGPIWNFSTLTLNKPTTPYPVNAGTDLSVSSSMSWVNGGGATTYDIYFGTDSTPDAGEFIANSALTSFYAGTLGYGTTYYWRIDAVNGSDKVTGDVWSFITESSTFTPTDLASLVLWLEGNGITGLSNTNPVSTWPDDSPANHDGTQTGGNRPTYRTNQLNSLPIVRFDGSDDYITMGDVLDITNAGYTVSVVCKITNLTNAQMILSKYDESPVDVNFYTQFVPSDGVYFAIYGASNGSSYIYRKSSSSDLPSAGSWNIFTFVYDGGTTPTAIKIYKNGTQIDNAGASGGSFTAPANSTTPLVLGRGFGTSTAYSFNGDVAEVIVCNSALSDTDRNNVITYLQNKYAL